MQPLSDEEFENLNEFLLDEALSEETMTLDCLDGYLTALVIGPEVVPMGEWLPLVWGPDETHAPEFEEPAHAGIVVELILRHMNGIVSSFIDDPDEFTPLFYAATDEQNGEQVDDAEPWVIGFLQGVDLRRDAWQPLFDDEAGQAWLRPLILLGADDLSEEEQAQRQTPSQRRALSSQVAHSIVEIQRYWGERRELAYQHMSAATVRREAPKVGRNDPCPCGSGKKFKKCCGAAEAAA